jgi:hypothetical protein
MPPRVLRVHPKRHWFARIGMRTHTPQVRALNSALVRLRWLILSLGCQRALS